MGEQGLPRWHTLRRLVRRRGGTEAGKLIGGNWRRGAIQELERRDDRHCSIHMFIDLVTRVSTPSGSSEAHGCLFRENGTGSGTVEAGGSKRRVGMRIPVLLTGIRPHATAANFADECGSKSGNKRHTRNATKREPNCWKTGKNTAAELRVKAKPHARSSNRLRAQTILQVSAKNQRMLKRIIR